jgi:hypothetical protein
MHNFPWNMRKRSETDPVSLRFASFRSEIKFEAKPAHPTRRAPSRSEESSIAWAAPGDQKPLVGGVDVIHWWMWSMGWGRPNILHLQNVPTGHTLETVGI